MLLSVLMPSNRNLAESRKAIETALAFCERRDALLIVSDNSGDPEKRQLLRKASRRLRYIQPADDTPHTNLRTVLAAAETEFVLMMGDDDQLFVSPKDQPLDLASLGPGCIGIRPLVAVANSEGRVIRVKDFPILDETPGRRVMRYNNKAGGDNACYHSIFRRRPFADLITFFLDQHPVKGGYCDWALTCVMFAYGKLPYDPGVVFKYNYHQWDSTEKLDGQRQAIYAAANLPAETERFKLLLLYLDIAVLGLRRGSPLGEAGKRSLLEEAGRPILNGFLKTIFDERQLCDARTVELAQAMKTADTSDQFELALEMLDCLQPGLTERYCAFHRAAMEG